MDYDSDSDQQLSIFGAHGSEREQLHALDHCHENDVERFTYSYNRSGEEVYDDEEGEEGNIQYDTLDGDESWIPYDRDHGFDDDTGLFYHNKEDVFCAGYGEYGNEYDQSCFGFATADPTTIQPMPQNDVGIENTPGNGTDPMLFEKEEEGREDDDEGMDEDNDPEFYPHDIQPIINAVKAVLKRLSGSSLNAKRIQDIIKEMCPYMTDHDQRDMAYDVFRTIDRKTH